MFPGLLAYRQTRTMAYDLRVEESKSIPVADLYPRLWNERPCAPAQKAVSSSFESGTELQQGESGG